jgi:hypothetical protein
MVTVRGAAGGLNSLGKSLAIVVIVLLGWLAYSLATWFVSPTRDRPGASIVAVDFFGDGTSALDSPQHGAVVWVNLAGDWTMKNSTLEATNQVSGMNFAVGSLERQASIRATVEGDSYCGVVANVVDAKNYVALLRATPFLLWNVVQVLDGEPKTLGTVEDPATPKVSVELRVHGAKAWASVGPVTKDFSLQVTNVGNAAGFGQAGVSPPCHFDDAVLLQTK